MSKDELKSILEQHRLWIEGNGGKCADLRGADMQRADMQRANLQGANLRCADLRYADLQRADMQGADMQRADLRGADLRGAYLQRADLRGADLDCSCLPLWCGSKGMIVDWRIAAQIAAHFCALDCDDEHYQAAREAILEFARMSHRADDLGLVEERER